MDKKSSKEWVREKKDKTFSLRINEELYREAETLYARMGLSISSAIGVFLQQSVTVRGLPFPLSEDLEQYVREEAVKQLREEIKQGLGSGMKK